MSDKTRYYKCDRCGELYPVVDPDFAKRNGPHEVRFSYKDGAYQSSPTLTYSGEWCDTCTRAYLRPLTKLEDKVESGGGE
jgi:hypothetical protein